MIASFTEKLEKLSFPKIETILLRSPTCNLILEARRMTKFYIETTFFCNRRGVALFGRLARKKRVSLFRMVRSVETHPDVLQLGRDLVPDHVLEVLVAQKVEHEPRQQAVDPPYVGRHFGRVERVKHRP